MTYTTARCGHAVPAVGAPGSNERRKCERSLCGECFKAWGFAVLPYNVSADERVFDDYLDAETYP